MINGTMNFMVLEKYQQIEKCNEILIAIEWLMG